MDKATRLQWVARNRRRESGTKPIGLRMAGLADDLARRALVIEEAIGGIVGVVDDEFCSLCCVEGIKDGVLRLRVADVGAVANLSRKWSGRLQRALPARLRIKRITFAYGTGGYRIN